MNRPLRSGLAGIGLAALFLIMLAPNSDASSTSTGRGLSDHRATIQPSTSHAGATSLRAIPERSAGLESM